MNTEALYGGAAGGGKSDALLMAALMFVDFPGYNAIIFRRTYSDLALPEALIARSIEWLKPTEAHWDGINHIWHFPSGACLAFGNMEHENDKYRYQSAAFQCIELDELTQFTESQYRYLFSRLRRLEDSNIPLRMRGASNPGNIGHDWVKQRFMIEGAKYGRIFIPARLDDNPNLDRQKYEESLRELDPITRRQYLQGDWTARHGGSIFKREWFSITTDYPHDSNKVRYWDLAATKPEPNKDPDYSVGALVAEKQGIYYVIDIQRVQAKPLQVENLIQQCAELDGATTRIYMEQEPGSSGVVVTDHYAREVLQGYAYHAIRSTGSKQERATPMSSAAEAGNIRLLKGTWNTAFLDELEAFPQGSHDDQVDAVSGAFAQLRKRGHWA